MGYGLWVIGYGLLRYFNENDNVNDNVNDNENDNENENFNRLAVSG